MNAARGRAARSPPLPAVAARDLARGGGAGLEVALQDDYVFVEQYYHGRERALSRSAPAGRHAAARQRQVGGRRAAARRAARRSGKLRLGGLRQPDRRRRALRHPPADDVHRPGAGVGDVGPQGRRARRARRRCSGASCATRPSTSRAAWTATRSGTSRTGTPSSRRPTACRKNHWVTRLRRRASAALYRALYVAGHRAVKAVDPQAQVLFGELAPQAERHARRSRRRTRSSPLAILREITCSKRSWKAAQRCPRPGRGRVRAAPLRLHAPRRTSAVGRADDVTLATLDRLTTRARSGWRPAARCGRRAARRWSST